MELAEAEMMRFQRYGRPFTFIIMDLDRFKLINDRHGHLVGDMVLKKLADTITKQLRKVDILGRLGGEEFGILLPETGIAKGRVLAGRIQAALHKMSISTDSGKPLKVTASIGLSQITKGDNSLDVLISRADAALYKTKRLGRDRIETA
jgi:diguanylate cyclase (GGDEF)-like protein